MGVQGALAWALVVVGIALAVVALVVIFSKATSGRSRPAVLVAMTRPQRRRAAGLVRRGGPVASEELAGARAIAADQAGQAHVALLGAAGAALAASSLLFPWSTGVMPGWVSALFIAALALQVASAATVLVSVRRAHRFMAANPEPGAVGVDR